jgi:protein-tyrosine phosphatase
MASAMLREKFERVGAPGSVNAVVESAGFGFDDEGAHPASIAALAERGIDLRAHRSRRLAAEHIRNADLVLVMERAHVRKVSTFDPSAWARTFTLKEFVRRAEQSGPRPAGADLREWASHVHEGRSVDDLLGAADADDLEDPFGRSARAFERSANELDDLLDRLIALYAPA